MNSKMIGELLGKLNQLKRNDSIIPIKKYAQRRTTGANQNGGETPKNETVNNNSGEL